MKGIVAAEIVTSWRRWATEFDAFEFASLRPTTGQVTAMGRCDITELVNDFEIGKMILYI